MEVSRATEDLGVSGNLLAKPPRPRPGAGMGMGMRPLLPACQGRCVEESGIRLAAPFFQTANACTCAAGALVTTKYAV